MRERVKVLELFDTFRVVDQQRVLIGSINDIRTWAKNLWKSERHDFMEIIALSIIPQLTLTEEDYYTFLDEEVNLIAFLDGCGYGVRELCEIPLEDFYDENKAPQELVDEVIAQIKMDVELGDVTGLDELLKGIGIKELTAYLPEK